METISLRAEPRTSVGKGAARKLRQTGKAPALLYRGGNKPTMLAIDPVELEVKLRRTGNRNALLRVETVGGERLCIVKAIQRHPLTRRLLHVDFYEVQEDKPVEVMIRVEAVGRSIGVKKGGQIRILRPWLKARCIPSKIPAAIAIDVTDLDIGHMARVDQVAVPDGVELVFDSPFNVLAIGGRAYEEEVVQEETETVLPAMQD